MVNYADKKIGWLVYPIFAVSFIFIANDNELSTLVRLPSFKWDLLFSLLAVTTVGLYIAWLTRYLDRKENAPWDSKTQKRLKLQFLFGIVAPLSFSIGSEVLYLKWINIPLSTSSILNLELPLAFIYLFLINLLYYLNYISASGNLKKGNYHPSDLLNQRVSIKNGSQESLIKLEEVAFIRSSEKFTWLNTMKEKQCLIHGTLNEWEKKLPKELFYRLNRQVIANRDSIQNFEVTETRRIKVFLVGSDVAVFVPKTKATEFRKWLRE